MLEIIFQSIDDAKKFQYYIQTQLGPSHLNSDNILLIEDQYIGKVKIDNSQSVIETAAKEAFFQFLIKIKLNDWFRFILKEQFHYDDEEEQQQILDIMQSILEGNRVELASLIDGLNMNRELQDAIDQMFRDHLSFSFESFVRFRMRPFMDQLEKYVEISIDEYKMEQEYQMFIQTLREFLMGRDAKINHLHLLLDDGVTFFDEQFYEIKRMELVRMIDRKLISNHPVYVDSVTIAPLLSIAPTTIFLYSDDCEQPLVRTICNIFEERVVKLPISSFYQRKGSFSYYSDKENSPIDKP
ncbi:putative sporulation protein YtxC [Bacillus dakarensis]|uniref:putative sporulation protein YtxC n=1 Tax=Robertmurraya dakarensis TaxID=1926278 RepID=UPI00098221BC|nr:putative sporulation protein YtxC [Bacillus dakarensis]